MRGLCRWSGILVACVSVALSANSVIAEDPPVDNAQPQAFSFKPFQWVTSDIHFLFLSAVPKRNEDAPPVANEQLYVQPLTPEHEKYLREILSYWERRNRQIKTYSCKFQRWEYDPVWGPKTAHKTYSTGVITYIAPNKGTLRVNVVKHYVPPKPGTDKATYKANEDTVGDHWASDGESLFEFDTVRKRLVQRELPPEMKGRLTNFGPLPCLLSVEAERLKERFWMRVVTPEDCQGEYWLELVPKQNCDAVNFKKIELIIDEQDFLPKAVQVFRPGSDEKANSARVVYQFTDRKVNAQGIGRAPFIGCQFPLKAPAGWDYVVEKLAE